MRNNVLYFPYIRVPSSAWFTRILLYWDKIGSIVPYDYIANPNLHEPYTRSLIQENLVTQVMPGMYLTPRHTESFIAYLETLGPMLEERRTAFMHSKPANIHLEKMGNIGDELVNMSLATSTHYPWYMVEDETANDYMSYLATALGQQPDLQFAPVTDEIDCLNRLSPIENQTGLGDRELSALRMEILEEVLPAPATPLSASEIAIFKAKHGDELGRFRREIELELTNIADISDFHLREKRLELIKEKVREETGEICSKMQGEGWHGLVFGKLCALLGSIPGVGVVPKLISAVYKALADTEPVGKRLPLAYAAYAQTRLLGVRNEILPER